MSVRVYDKDSLEPPVLRPTTLRLMQDGDTVVLHAVNKHGASIAAIAGFGPRCSQKYKAAKNVLEMRGFDTSFASWDEEGRIVLKWDCREEHVHHTGASDD